MLQLLLLVTVALLSPSVAKVFNVTSALSTTESCPLGFELNELGECVCDASLRFVPLLNTVTCEIHNNTSYITREGALWLGVDTDLNDTDASFWYSLCLYCIWNRVSVDLRSPDMQCSLNRRGFVCGRCRPNYSLQLGGNGCIRCDNNRFLSLLIVFVLLGILLVVFIKLLDLTVANGTVNGFIFYSNIVWSFNTVLFQRRNIGYYIITLPIAWINLDFGIESCFIEDLNQLTKSLLQYIFPAYILLIIFVIFLLSHYSTRATRLLGGNSVPLFSTLFLLVFVRVLRNTSQNLTFVTVTAFKKTNNQTVILEDTGNIRRKVWAYDGSVQFAVNPGHICLMIISLITLFLSGFFALILVLVPFLRRKSEHRILCWLDKLNPFFDTFYGPLNHKPQHQVWIGILLFARLVLTLTSLMFVDPSANMLMVMIVCSSLMLYSAIVGSLYKKWYLTVLEQLYIFNLTILGGSFLFTQTRRQDFVIHPAATMSVCAALLQFIGILIFHAVRRITALVSKLKQTQQEHETEMVPFPKEVGDDCVPTIQNVRLSALYHLGESVLEDNL